jgi:hypothetical protein
MAYTLSDFLRTWTVTDTHDLMDDYVNTNKKMTLYLRTAPDLVGCATESGYSKQANVDWTTSNFTATIDPTSPPNIMLRSRATDSNEGGVDGNNVYFRIIAEPGGGGGQIRCYMVTLGSGHWNGTEG